MTELEILAQLKHAYLSLEDIVENAERVQIEDKSYIKIFIMPLRFAGI